MTLRLFTFCGFVCRVPQPLQKPLICDMKLFACTRLFLNHSVLFLGLQVLRVALPTARCVYVHTKPNNITASWNTALVLTRIQALDAYYAVFANSSSHYLDILELLINLYMSSSFIMVKGKLLSNSRKAISNIAVGINDTASQYDAFILHC